MGKLPGICLTDRVQSFHTSRFPVYGRERKGSGLIDWPFRETKRPDPFSSLLTPFPLLILAPGGIGETTRNQYREDQSTKARVESVDLNSEHDPTLLETPCG